MVDPDIELEPDTTWWRVICRTDHCFNQDTYIDVIASVENPKVVCGPCGQEITEMELIEL